MLDYLNLARLWRVAKSGISKCIRSCIVNTKRPEQHALRRPYSLGKESGDLMALECGDSFLDQIKGAFEFEFELGAFGEIEFVAAAGFH